MLRLAALLSERVPRRPGLLLQLGRRGERGGDQDRAQGDRPARGSSRSRAASTAARSGALSATGQPAKWEGFGPLVPGVSFARPNDVESLEAAVAPAATRADPARARARRGRRDPARAGVRAGRGRARRRDRRAALRRRGAGRAWAARARSSPTSSSASRPTSSRSRRGSANGLPIGALLAGERARAAGSCPGDHGSTFGGNPVACAAALRGRRGDRRRAARGRPRARRAARRGLEALPGVREVRGRGLLLGAELDRARRPGRRRLPRRRGCSSSRPGRTCCG